MVTYVHAFQLTHLNVQKFFPLRVFFLQCFCSDPVNIIRYLYDAYITLKTSDCVRPMYAFHGANLFQSLHIYRSHMSLMGTGVPQSHHSASLPTPTTVYQTKQFWAFLATWLPWAWKVFRFLIRKDIEEKEKYFCICYRSRPPSICSQSKDDSCPRHPCFLYRFFVHYSS